MIICADDFGLSDDINEATLSLIDKKRISAVTCLVNAKSFNAKAAEKLLGFESEIDIGLHFALTEVPPVSSLKPLSGLVREDGCFHGFDRLCKQAYLGRIDSAEVQNELAAQYREFLRVFGRPPDFIDGHLHVQQLPQIRKGVLSFVTHVTSENKRPLYVRNAYLPVWKNITQNVSPLKTWFISVPGKTLRRELARQDIATNNGFAGIYEFQKHRFYPAFFSRFLKRIKDPTGIVVVHPGLQEDWRKSEYETLVMNMALPSLRTRFFRSSAENPRVELAKPRPTDLVKAYFDTAASDYNERSSAGIWKLFRRMESNAIGRLIDGNSLQNVLELGCGAGFYSRLLHAKRSGSLTCVDFSAPMLERIEVPGCKKVLADIQTFTSIEKFDLILCTGALEFLADPASVFKNAAQMLKQQGSLVVLVPNDSLLGKMYRFFHKTHEIDLRLFGRTELCQIAAAAGLEAVASETVLPFSLAMRFSKINELAEVA